jgi:hypothetical protein
VGLPLIGLASVPASYLLLEKCKLAVIPQFQPMRALLFATVVLLIAACAAGLKAASEKRPAEALLWLFVTFLVPMQLRFDQLWQMPWPGITMRRVALALALAAVAALAAWLAARSPRWSAVFLACAILLPFPLIPAVAGLHKAAPIETSELRELSDWARASTPIYAVFLFPDAGRGLEPGVFRAQALRALYVDWKSGGQVNYLRKFSEEWWRRWRQTTSLKPLPQAISLFADWGVDYIVVRPEHRIEGRATVYENERFLVYRTSH